MPENAWVEGLELVDECVDDRADQSPASGPPLAVLLGLLTEGLALVAMGAWILVAG